MAEPEGSCRRSRSFVPTFKPANGRPTRRLDFVFASRDLVDRVVVRALSRDEEWGPSDRGGSRSTSRRFGLRTDRL